MTRSGGQVLVDQLELNGIDLVFCLPGESFLPVLDALYDSPIRLVSCRHEPGASNAAEAYGKLTGRPGVCLVTRGPGATQAAVGVHTAKQDSTPMLLLVGHVPRAFEGREAWQELDYARVFGGIAKAAWHVDTAERIPEHMARAFSLALSGRPGPVVLALPEDVLAETTEVDDAPPVEIARSAPRKGLRSVTPTAGDMFEPSWSPDGTKIAYQEEGAIFTVELGGGDVKRLTDTENNDSSPAWNPKPPAEGG